VNAETRKAYVSTDCKLCNEGRKGHRADWRTTNDYCQSPWHALTV